MNCQKIKEIVKHQKEKKKCQRLLDTNAYLEERFLEARTRILPRECSMSGHFKCRASPMRRPEENIRQSSALNFKSVMEERKTRISSLVGTKGR